MALDATVGGASADSYGSVGEADTYHSDFGNTDWAAAVTADKESAMRRAAVALDGKYRNRWPGTRTNGRSQARDWPRTDAVDSDGEEIDSASIPTEVKYAQYEMALAELTEPGVLSPRLSRSEVVRSEKVGPISTEYAVSDNVSTFDAYPTLASVERLLSGIVSGERDDPAALVV